MDRLNTIREYQAMLAVEKSITEISEVLGVLAETEVNEPTLTVAMAPPQPELAAAPEAPLEDSEAVSPIDAAADRLSMVLGLTNEPFDKRIS